MGRNFWNPFKPRHHSSKNRHGFLGAIKDTFENTADVFTGKEPRHLKTSRPKPIPPRPPTIPVEPEAPIKPSAPPKEVVTIEQADDIHQTAVLNQELQALEDVEKKEVDLLGRFATKIDPPVNFADFVKDLSGFVSKQAREEYLEENFAELSSLNPKQISRLMLSIKA